MGGPGGLKMLFYPDGRQVGLREQKRDPATTNRFFLVSAWDFFIVIYQSIEGGIEASVTSRAQGIKKKKEGTVTEGVYGASCGR